MVKFCKKNKAAVITSNGLLMFRIPFGIIITSIHVYWCISALPALTVAPALCDMTYGLCQTSIHLCAALVVAHCHMGGCPVVYGAEFQAIFMLDCKVYSGGQQNCGDRN